MHDFVRFRIDSPVQPVVVTIEANHFLANRELIRTHRRDGLEIGLLQSVVDRHVAAFDAQLMEKLTGIPQ